MVYLTELQGIEMALEITCRYAGQHWTGQRFVEPLTIILFMDNQAALRTMTDLGNAQKTGEQIVKRCIDIITCLQKLSTEVQLQWVPGHRDIQDNKEVDQLAKLAAQRHFQ
jgi:ribonuclease HI